jgi:hypothetical protein
MKMDLKEIGWKVMKRILLAQVRDEWPERVNRLLKFRVS